MAPNGMSFVFLICFFWLSLFSFFLLQGGLESLACNGSSGVKTYQVLPSASICEKVSRVSSSVCRADCIFKRVCLECPFEQALMRRGVSA